MLHVVLSLNGGSSSLKLSLYAVGQGESRLATGGIDRIGTPGGHLSIRDNDGRALADTPADFPDLRGAVHAALDALKQSGLPTPQAVGHRIVHGGPDHVAPERIDAHLITALRHLAPFAPLHLPAQIDAVEAVAARFPQVPQVACFDTAFHRHMPERAQRLPLPGWLWEEGVRRYGFHGLSYEYVLQEVPEIGRGRAIIAHLGNGASMAALRDGRGMDTTMGFTPTAGLMMGTRSGDLDPGVLLYLLAEKGYGADALEGLVNREAGLLGVSGLSPDMRTLLEKREENPAAALAVEMFCYQARKHIGALAAVVGGVDNLVFTGGIGEHAAPVRWEVCHGLDHLGVQLDPVRNEAHAAVISAAGCPCVVRIVATDEDRMIARHTRAVVDGPSPDSASDTVNPRG